MLCIDLDDFKTVNDSLGHAAGDRMLQEVGGRLRSVVRRADSVARLGGDEFAVLVDGEPADAAVEIADRLLAELSEPVVLGPNSTAHSSASIGIAFGSPDDSVESLLRDADIAMYTAKNNGKSALGGLPAGNASAGARALRAARRPHSRPRARRVLPALSADHRGRARAR